MTTLLAYEKKDLEIHIMRFGFIDLLDHSEPVPNKRKGRGRACFCFGDIEPDRMGV